MFIDDVSLHIEAFEKIEPRNYENLCFICTSRKARWRKYGRKLPSCINLFESDIRKLNENDLKYVLEKINRYGTTVHLKSREKPYREQLKELKERSQKDMLILIRELGDGVKFDRIVKSELSELDRHQRFAYLLICLSDRNQIPLPRDLFTYAFKSRYPDIDANEIIQQLGGLAEYSKGKRTIYTRHSTIAQHIVEKYNKVVGEDEINGCIQSFLKGFGYFRAPIIVHHGNSGIARVFKAIINSKYLSRLLGDDGALSIYRAHEKIFEKDAFYWQQYGICQTKNKMYELAIETLDHANALHDHFYIKHSLGRACLLACAELRLSGLKKYSFGDLRKKGRDLLRGLHEERGYEDDLPISTLAHWDLKVEEIVEGGDMRQLAELYHRELAKYLLDYPKSRIARDAYENLNSYLTKGQPFRGLLKEEQWD